MLTLNDVILCTNPNPGACFHHIHLLYRKQGIVMNLPSGYPPCPCDYCKWLNRSEDFHTPMEEKVRFK